MIAVYNLERTLRHNCEQCKIHPHGGGPIEGVGFVRCLQQQCGMVRGLRHGACVTIVRRELCLHQQCLHQHHSEQKKFDLAFPAKTQTHTRSKHTITASVTSTTSLATRTYTTASPALWHVGSLLQPNSQCLHCCG